MLFTLKRIFFKTNSEKKLKFILYLKESFGIVPKDFSLYKMAFTHSSVKINNNSLEDFERLEHLGDAFLNLTVTNHLYHKYRNKKVGELAEMKSKTVSRKFLNKFAKDIIKIEYVNSKIPKNNFPDAMYGNIFEAMIGAVYLDRGYSYATNFLEKIFINNIDSRNWEEMVLSYKSLFYRWIQKHNHEYDLKVSQISTNKLKATLLCENERFEYIGKNKKDAIEMVMKGICEKLKINL